MDHPTGVKFQVKNIFKIISNPISYVSVVSKTRKVNWWNFEGICVDIDLASSSKTMYSVQHGRFCKN